MATIAYHHVHKAFREEAPALADFTLPIEDGEFMVLVGPSGCGKSTALRLLAGLEEPTAGDIRIGGKSVIGLPPEQRDIAMVFQNYALYPHMTVRANLAFPLRMAGWNRERIVARVGETARLLELEPLLERRPGELSGGQRQRVAMGRALVREPAVFLLDEPLSNLDAQLRGLMRREITALQQRLRTTTIYVTHDQVEAMTMGSRLAVLDRGRLQQVGTPREIYEHPANVFVATFIGSPRMNLFATTLVSAAGGRAALRLGAQTVPLPDPWQQRLAASHPGRDAKITAGLRPEAFALQAPGSSPLFSARVVAVEPLGHEQIIHFEAGLEPNAARAPGAAFTARLPAHGRATVGETLGLTADLSQVHLFDEDGNAVAGARPLSPGA